MELHAHILWNAHIVVQIVDGRMDGGEFWQLLTFLCYILVKAKAQININDSQLIYLKVFQKCNIYM